jgi:hypothetical protein
LAAAMSHFQRIRNMETPVDNSVQTFDSVVVTQTSHNFTINVSRQTAGKSCKVSPTASQTSRPPATRLAWC